MKTKLILLVIFILLLVSCAPPNGETTVYSNSTRSESDICTKTNSYYINMFRCVDTKYNNVCYLTNQGLQCFHIE